MQTVEEVRRIADDWGRNYAPKDMIQNEKNAGLLTNYCLNQFGAVTAGGLTQAYNALRARLDLTKEPTKAELAAKLEAKMRKDYQNSIEPQNLNRGAEVAAKAAADKLAATERAISSEINGYIRDNAFGYQDFPATESGQNQLRLVASKYNRSTLAGAQAALDAVRVTKSKLP